MTPLQLAVRETVPFPGTTLRRLRRLLLEERRAQLGRAAALVERDEVDTATMTVESELAPVLVAQARQTVVEIDQAVARMDAGTYGRCEACGERLPIARLEAIPHARSCVTCQTASEPAQWRRGGWGAHDGEWAWGRHRRDERGQASLTRQLGSA